MLEKSETPKAGMKGLFECPPSSTHRINYKIVNYNLQNPYIPVDVWATPDELQQLAVQGYLLRKNIFSPEVIKVLKQATDKLTEDEMQHEKKEYYPGNGLFIRYLIDKDPVFLNLLKYPPILSVIRAMLGPQVQLMDMVARVTFLDEPHQKLMWHIHNRVVPNPLPPFFAHPHSLDAIIYLDDADKASGPLCVIPGSHKQIHLEMEFRDHTDKQGQLMVPLRTGDCVFSHSNLWHRVLPSTRTGQKGDRRRVLLLGFMPAWFKREFPKGIRPKQRVVDTSWESLDDETKELLGHFEWI